MNEYSDNFKEYLEEFSKTISFDSETCPVCGLKVSDSLLVFNSPHVDLIKINNEKVAESIYRRLMDNKIDFNVYKEIDDSILGCTKYQFRFVVKIKEFEDAEKLIKELSLL
jgi:hypothetical protein